MMRTASITTDLPLPRTDAKTAAAAVPLASRQWMGLAIGSLLIAGLLSLLVVLGRLPFSAHWIADPLFFQRCLVVHVNLSLIVWFYAFAVALAHLELPDRFDWVSRISIFASAAGIVLMLAGAVVPGAQPVLANYIPVIDHPYFLWGLALVFAGVIAGLLPILFSARKRLQRVLPEDAAVGVQATAVAVVLAAVTWISAYTGMPEGVGQWVFFEFTAWGAGHVLQVANVCMMLSVWLWTVQKLSGKALFTPGQARLVFGLLLVPHMLMPLLPWEGSLSSLYIHGSTQLMRWGIFPVVLFVLVLSLRHLRKNRIANPDGQQRALRIGFQASFGLTLMGFILGAMIRGSTTLVPAHYHAALGGVTVALMLAAYLIADWVRSDLGKPHPRIRHWSAKAWQLGLFGIGQAVFALGFAIGGSYGLGRKTYAAESATRSTGELVGVSVMGIGGLMAAAGGLLFLFLIFQELRLWITRSPDAAS